MIQQHNFCIVLLLASACTSQIVPSQTYCLLSASWPNLCPITMQSITKPPSTSSSTSRGHGAGDSPTAICLIHTLSSKHLQTLIGQCPKGTKAYLASSLNAAVAS